MERDFRQLQQLIMGESTLGQVSYTCCNFIFPCILKDFNGFYNGLAVQELDSLDSHSLFQ
jgi:hypothetical protein